MKPIESFLLDQAPDAVFWTRRDGSFAYVNEAASRNLGYTREQLLELSIFDIDPEIDRTAWKRHWRAASTKDTIVLRRRHRRRDGSTIPVEVHIRHLQHEGEEIHASFVRDLTGTVRIQELEASRNAYLEALFTQSPAPQLILDPEDGAILDANPAALKFYGYDLDAIRALNVDRINTLETDAIFEEMRRAVRRERNHFEFRHRMADGRIRDVHVHSAPVPFEGRKVLHSTIQDVTPLVDYQRKLERFRDRIENLPVGVYRNTPGPEGRILEANPALAAILEVESVDELIGRRVSDFYPEPAQREAFSDHLEQVGRVRRHERELVTSRGNRIWVAISARATSEQGETVFDGAIEDITDTRHHERAMRQAEAVLEAAREGITITDADRRIERVNPAFTRITGYTPKEVIGRNPRILSSGRQGKEFYARMWNVSPKPTSGKARSGTGARAAKSIRNG